MKHPKPGENKREERPKGPRDHGEHLHKGIEHLMEHHREVEREVDNRHLEPHKPHGGHLPHREA